jgi:hypothetical protein
MVVAVVLLSAPARAGADCEDLQQQRDALARASLQAEIALLQSVRQRLCPREEALAATSNATADAEADQAAQAEPEASQSDQPLDQPLDFDAYIRCREQAEAELQRSRPVLHRNQRGFTFYTEEGARLATLADGLQEQLQGQCGP